MMTGLDVGFGVGFVLGFATYFVFVLFIWFTFGD
jgi:hypothetical protein